MDSKIYSGFDLKNPVYSWKNIIQINRKRMRKTLLSSSKRNIGASDSSILLERE